jgi:hypothetical protein
LKDIWDSTPFRPSKKSILGPDILEASGVLGVLDQCLPASCLTPDACTQVSFGLSRWGAKAIDESVDSGFYHWTSKTALPGKHAGKRVVLEVEIDVYIVCAEPMTKRNTDWISMTSPGLITYTVLINHRNICLLRFFNEIMSVTSFQSALVQGVSR